MVATATLKQRAKKKLAGNWWTATLVVGFLSIVGLITGMVVQALRQPVLDRADAILDMFLETGDRAFWSQYIVTFSHSLFYTAVDLIATVFRWLFTLPLVLFFLGLAEGKKATFKQFAAGFPRAGESFVLYLLMAVKIFLWTLLFVIPGIIKSFSYMLAPMIKAKNPDRTANECIAESCRLMNGNKASAFVLYLTFIGWALLIVLAELGADVIPFVGSYASAFVGFAAGCVLEAYIQTTVIEFYREVVSPTPLYSQPAPKTEVYEECKNPKEEVFEELNKPASVFGDFYDAPPADDPKGAPVRGEETNEGLQAPKGDSARNEQSASVGSQDRLSGTSYAAQQQKKDDRDER